MGNFTYEFTKQLRFGKTNKSPTDLKATYLESVKQRGEVVCSLKERVSA
jgi:hypothetical protein